MKKLFLSLLLSLFSMVAFADTPPTFTGLYIQSTRGYCVQTGQTTDGFGDTQVEVKIYENRIVIRDLTHGFTKYAHYRGTTGRTKYYVDDMGTRYYVRMDYSMYMESYYKGLTFQYQMTRVH